MKHKFLMVLCFLMVSSCMRLKKKEDEFAKPATQAQVQVQEVKVEKPFVNERTELDYEYEISDDNKELPAVRFLASADWPNEVLLIKKGEKEEQKLIHFNDKGEWKDFLTSENKINYKFFSKVGTQTVLLDEVEVLPILELKLTDDLNLADKYKLNSKTKVIYISNLEITEQKHLFLNDYSGQIVIQNIISTGGIIQSFAPTARANVDLDGKSGGQIRLDILSGSGILNVVMKGENGGNGTPAKAPDGSKKGLRGIAGTPAEFTSPPCTFDLLGTFIPCLVRSYNCTLKPTDGFYGGKGQKGFPGNNGKIGGNSGSILLYNNSDQLKVSLATQQGSFGIGSVGGQGGVGGDGGLGGDGGAVDLDNYLRKNNLRTKLPDYNALGAPCSPARNGEIGPEGDVGDPGYNGELGKNQLSCLYLNDQKVKCIND